MDQVYEFMSAALPWVSMGILLAVFLAKAASRKKDGDRKENYGSEGMALGMSLGVALGTALHVNIGIAMVVGMLLGLLLGSGFEKKDDGNGKDDR